MLWYAPVLFVKVTLYSVDVYGKRTLSYGGLPMFLHRHSRPVSLECFVEAEHGEMKMLRNQNYLLKKCFEDAVLVVRI